MESRTRQSNLVVNSGNDGRISHEGRLDPGDSAVSHDSM